MLSLTDPGPLQRAEEAILTAHDDCQPNQQLLCGALRPPPTSPSILSTQSSIHFFAPLESYSDQLSSPPQVRPSQAVSDIADLSNLVWPTLSCPARQDELQPLLSGRDEEQALSRSRRDSAQLATEHEEEEVKTIGSFVLGSMLIRRTSNSISRPTRQVTTLVIENIRRLLTTNLYHTSGLISVPLALLSYLLDWHPAVIMILNGLAVGTCSFMAAGLFEDLTRASHTHVPGYSFIAEAIWTNPAWICVGSPN